MLDMKENKLFGNLKVGGRFIFHTRLATHGKKKEFNIQPLINCRYIIAHNGIFSMWNTIGKYYGIKEKFSDSYTILKLITERGIKAFYEGFLDKIYGVVLVYDKATNMTYLLKTGGAFEMGKLKSGKYIYGSSNLDFWGIEKTKKLEDGMYILKPYECIQIHKPKNDYYGTYTYDQYYGGYVKTYKRKDYETVYNNDGDEEEEEETCLKPDAIIHGIEFYDWGKSDLDYIDLDKIHYDDIDWDESDYPCGYHPDCDNDCGNCTLIDAYYQQKTYPNEDITDYSLRPPKNKKYTPDYADYLCGKHPRCNYNCEDCPLIDWGEEEEEWKGYI